TILVDYRIKWWGSFPVWVALLLVGREVLITAFRFFAKRRGVVIPAVGAGKLKAVVQNIFIGATIAWFAWKDAIAEMHLAGAFRNFWDQFHGWFAAITPAGAAPRATTSRSGKLPACSAKPSSSTPPYCAHSKSASVASAALCPRSFAPRPKSRPVRRCSRTRGAPLRGCGWRIAAASS